MAEQDWKPVVLMKAGAAKPKTAAGVAKAKAEGKLETQLKGGRRAHDGCGSARSRVIVCVRVCLTACVRALSHVCVCVSLFAASHAQSNTYVSAQKLDQETADFHCTGPQRARGMCAPVTVLWRARAVPAITHEFKVALMQARQAKKWTQAELAQV